MGTSRQTTINTNEIFSQENDVAQSDQVALLMGAFSVVLLGIVGLVLSAIHSLLS